MSKSNIKKAEELATESQFLSDFPHDKASVYYGALKMAEWKDEQNAFKHPLGTKLWWVGMEYENQEWVWKIVEREVTAVRTTQWFNEEKPCKQIFLSGMISYEGEYWYDDEFQIMKECDGTEWHCAGYMCDAVFETKEEAEKYLQWDIDYQKKRREHEDDNVKSLDSDMSKVVSDNFWKLV